MQSLVPMDPSEMRMEPMEWSSLSTSTSLNQQLLSDSADTYPCWPHSQIWIHINLKWQHCLPDCSSPGPICMSSYRPIGPQPYLACVEFCLDNKSVTTDIKWTYAADTSVYDYLKVDYDIVQGIQTLKHCLPI